MPEHADEVRAEVVGAYVVSLSLLEQRKAIERLALIVAADRGWTATEIIERLN